MKTTLRMILLLALSDFLFHAMAAQAAPTNYSVAVARELYGTIAGPG